jgi:subtilase family serine protease
MRIMVVSVSLFAAALAPAAVTHPELVAPSSALAFHAACPRVVAAESARCAALIGPTSSRGAPQGYGPADLQAAYDLPSSTNGAGQTIAIVDAYDDPNAETDLAVYRQTFGLPVCTTANGCFKKVNQRGEQGHYARPDAAWAAEMSVDVDMVSAGCPNCNILLVEADSNAAKNLGEAVVEAVLLGAAVVSNSYGGDLGERNEKWYEHHHAVILASASGFGSGPQEPAAFPTVVAVGGTTLTRDHSRRGWSETAFGSGGCTTFRKEPWQHDAFCTTRTTNDVAAVADPSTGVAAYDSYGLPGFFVAGGTAVSAPLVASVYGLAANAQTLFAAKSIYKHHRDLYDIAPKGFDEPTGWGTPNGIGAF